MQICTTNIHTECIPEVHQMQRKSPKQQKENISWRDSGKFLIGILMCG